MGMRKSFAGVVVAAFALAGVAGGFSLAGAEEELTIKAIMKEGFKGDTSLNKKISSGTATAEEKKRYLTLAEALGKAKPEKGDADSWSTKTKALTEAATAVVEGKGNAGDLLKAASNCKACHEVHKG